MATNGSAQKVGIPRPAAPSPIGDNLRQDVSFYKSLRSVVDVLNQQATGPGTASISFGTAATNASDGKPATFNQGAIDCVMIRILPAGSAVTGVPNMWVAGGADTDIKHGLNRVPIGYFPVRTSQGVAVSDGATAWTNTDIYFKTDHSDTDVVLVIF